MPVYSNNNSIKNQKQQSIKNKVGIALICISSVFLINLIFNIIKFVNSFLLGTFGLFSYAIFISLIVLGIMLLKNVKVKLETSEIVYLISWLTIFVLILHLLTSSQFLNQSYGNYIASCYNHKLTCGGALSAILTYPINFVFTHIVASVTILAIALIIISAILLVKFVSLKNTKTKINKTENSQPELQEQDVVNEPELDKSYSTNTEQFNDDLIIPDEEAFDIPESSQVVLETNEEDKLKAKNILGLSNEKPELIRNNGYNGSKQINDLNPTYDNKFSDFDRKYAKQNTKPQKFLHSQPEVQAKTERKLTEKDKENLKYLSDITGGLFGKSKLKEETKTEVVEPAKPDFQDYDVMQDLYDERITKNNYQQTFSKPERTFTPNNNSATQPTSSANFTKTQKPYSSDFGYNNSNGNKFSNNTSAIENPDAEDNSIFENNFTQTNSVKLETEPVKEYKQVKFDVMEEREKPKKKLYRKPPKYVKPPIDLLKVVDNSKSVVSEDHTEKARVLEETLSSFNIPAKVVTITKGPAITRFELQMQQGVSVKKVLGHVEDIAMSLEARGDVRMEIPIAGKNAFGVEVPNESIDMVGLREILESYNFQGSKYPLTYALGKDITGNCVTARIEKMPHMLVAGATGSGKSVCLNSLLISLLYKASPQDVRIILVDPKQVEFTLYNGLPHMLIPNVITNPEKAMQALDWVISEMERRFTLFSQARVRNLEEYNNTEEVISELNEKLPYIVFIIDEIGDLMLNNKKEIEEKIQKITQKSRAAGIHLIVATQRPSVDVITGKIKANLNSRIAFAVASFADSKTILDQGGAEKLLGRGDMLYSPIDKPEPTRIQGAFVSNEEVEAVVEFVKEHNEANFDEEIEDAMFNKKQGGFNAGGPATHQEFDPLLKDACRLIIKTGSVSTSKLQRAFGLGFPRAGKIVDQMEAAGFISAPDAKKIRTVFITQQEFEERFGEDL